MRQRKCPMRWKLWLGYCHCQPILCGIRKPWKIEKKTQASLFDLKLFSIDLAITDTCRKSLLILINFQAISRMGTASNGFHPIFPMCFPRVFCASCVLTLNLLHFSESESCLLAYRPKSLRGCAPDYLTELCNYRQYDCTIGIQAGAICDQLQSMI